MPIIWRIIPFAMNFDMDLIRIANCFDQIFNLS